MTTHISWRSIFYVNLPLGVLALIVLAATLPTITERRSHAIDYAGTLLLALGLSAIILLTTLGGNTYDWASPAIIGMGVFGVACLVALTFVERRAAEPILPPALFKNRVFVVTSAVGFVVGFALFGALTFLPLFQQTVRGLSPTASGLQLLPVMGGLLVTSILSGQVIARTGRYKVFPILGTAVAGTGMYLLSSLDETTSAGVAAFHMLILGLGLGMVMQVLVLVVQNSVPYDMLGVATSGSTLFRSIGGSLGTAILGAIFSGRLAAEVAGGDSQTRAFTDALHVVFLVAAGVVVIAFLLSWLIPEAPLRKTVDATVVGDTIGGPVDTDSLRELTRALSRAAGRDRTLAFMKGVIERAGVDLSPAASWALLRLGAPEGPTVAELAALPHVRADRLAAAMGELREGGLVAGERVTPDGRRAARAARRRPHRRVARADLRVGAREVPGARRPRAPPGRRARPGPRVAGMARRDAAPATRVRSCWCSARITPHSRSSEELFGLRPNNVAFAWSARRASGFEKGRSRRSSTKPVTLPSVLVLTVNAPAGEPPERIL